LDVWPENVTPFLVFRQMATQWTMGINGPIGLRVEALELFLRAERVPRAEWQEVMQAVQVMEQETLRQWRKQVA
jgi:hypothetical protein